MDSDTENRNPPRPAADGDGPWSTGGGADAAADATTGTPGAARGPFGRIVAGALALLLFGAALMFSLLLFGVVLCLGALAWGYLWWKTRHARRTLYRQAAAGQRTAPPPEGRIIEGEVIRSTRAPDEPPR